MRRLLLTTLLWPLLLACDTAPPEGAGAADDSWDQLATAEQPATRVCGELGHVTGIDVSKWQGTIDWDGVAGDDAVDFVIMRASIGSSVDSQIHRNWSEAGRVGVPRGAYHYLYAEMSGTDQANLFLDTLESYGGYLPTDLPPVVDVEDYHNEDATAADFERTIREWVTVIEERLGRAPMIYTGHSWEGYGITGFGEYELWTPHYYYPSVECPRVPNSWDTWRIWQHSDSGSIDGIDGNVDLNHFNGTVEDWIAWRDIGAPAWWCEPIARLNAEGILERECSAFTNATRFTRAEVAKLVGASLHLEETPAYSLCPNPFSDVADDAWYEGYSSALAYLDYADGGSVFAPDGTFEPDAAPTRCEMVKVIVEAWDIDGSATAPSFSDYGSAPTWCQPLLNAATEAGIVVNTSDAFRPNDEATPGEVAAMLVRAIDTQGRTYPATTDFADAACRPACTVDMAEPNDTEATAYTLAPGTHGGLAACADADWYTIAAQGDVELNVITSAIDLELALTDASGAVMATPTRSADGYHYTFGLTADQVARLYVPAQRGYPAAYTVQIVADGVCVPACPACTTTEAADGCGGQCPATCDTTCDGDVCRAPCAEVCTPDAGACDGEQALSCQMDALGCYDWATVATCDGRTSCFEGACCTNPCEVDTARCIETAYERCEVVDGCPVWSRAATCEAGMCTLEGCATPGADTGITPTGEDAGIPAYTMSTGPVGGCSATGARGGLWALVPFALLARRRRRR